VPDSDACPKFMKINRKNKRRSDVAAAHHGIVNLED
jgi:hypothetical protein